MVFSGGSVIPKTITKRTVVLKFIVWWMLFNWVFNRNMLFYGKCYLKTKFIGLYQHESVKSNSSKVLEV